MYNPAAIKSALNRVGRAVADAEAKRAAPHAARQHCELGGSSAYRWTKCPGAPRMTRGVATQESQWAAEGTAAHEVAQRCLETGRDADDPELQLYVGYCLPLKDEADQYWIEAPINLASYDPPVPMWGIADFIAYRAKCRELHLVDLKYGKGVWVNAKNNIQLKFYALGALTLVNKPVARIVTTIIQPRFHNADPIRSAVIDPIELAEFSIELMAAARKTLEPDAPTVAGSHCKFCPATKTCLSYQNHRSNAAYHEFQLADELENRATGTRSFKSGILP